MTIPQMYKIYAHQNAGGVSVISWGTYIITTSFWLTYGILHKEKLLIYANILWLVLEVMIVVGALM